MILAVGMIVAIVVSILSIKFLMDNFDDNTKVFPGHGEATTIGFENKNNPYSIHWND